MCIEEIRSPENELLVISVDGNSIGRKKLCAILEGVPNMHVVTRPWPLFFSAWLQDPFFRFTIGGQLFEVTEALPGGPDFNINAAKQTKPVPEFENVATTLKQWWQSR